MTEAELTSTDLRLAKIYERSYRSFAPILCTETGGWVIQEGDIYLQARPVSYFGNGLYYSPWKAKDVPAKLRRAIQLYQPTGQGMTVIAGPSSPISAMRTELLSLGFRCNYFAPYMHLDLQKIRFPAKKLKGIEVRQITDYSIFKKHLHPWHEKPTTKPRRAMFAFLQKEVLKAKPRFWQFIVFEGDVPISSAMIFRKGSICGVYDVATLRTHRRRGFGHLVMATACAFARDQGMTAAGLGSSGPGVGLYTKTGFQLCGKYGIYYLGKDRVAGLKV